MAIFPDNQERESLIRRRGDFKEEQLINVKDVEITFLNKTGFMSLVSDDLKDDLLKDYE